MRRVITRTKTEMKSEYEQSKASPLSSSSALEPYAHTLNVSSIDPQGDFDQPLCCKRSPAKKVIGAHSTKARNVVGDT